MGGGGLAPIADFYMEQHIASKSPKDDITILDGGALKYGVAKLKEARALSGGAADLDKAADALIPALEKVQARLGPLAAYYTSRGYKEDNLARGKGEDAQMIAEFKAAVDAQEKFDAILKRDRSARTQKELAALKNSGNPLAYTTKSAVFKAEQMVDLFHDPADMGNAQILARADGLVKEIEPLLVEQRAALEKARGAAKSPIEAPDYAFESINRNLNEMIGAYREMKQSKNADRARDMVERYNSAVGDMNMIRR